MSSEWRHRAEAQLFGGEEPTRPWSVYKVGDCDWYMARSEDEARQAWKDFVNGDNEDDGEGDELIIRELTHEEMETLMIRDDEDGEPTKSFTAYLIDLINSPHEIGPTLFASTEY